MALPGVQTILKDQFLTLSRTDIPIGPRVVAIARRNTASGTGDVADLDPYNPTGEAAVIAVFGAESDMHRAYLELVSGGASRTTLIALPSDTVFNHNLGTISSGAYTAAGGSDLFADAFGAAESVHADIIVPWGRGSNATDYDDYATPATPGVDEIGFHADNTASVATSWAAKVAEKCQEITENSHPCFAVLGVKPYAGNVPSSGGMTPAQVASHLALTNLPDKESNLFGDTVDGVFQGFGFYVSVVVAEVIPLGYNNNYDFGYANGAATYAGFISQLDSWSAPTGKKIFNVSQIRYNPTRAQLTTMTDSLGVVPVALDFNRIPMWVDAQTFGRSTSDYTRLTNLRIVFDAILMVRQVAQKFIGEGSTIEARNALDAAITSGLRGMQQLGAILASDFTITYIANENTARVNLVLRPAFELRIIEVTVSIQV